MILSFLCLDVFESTGSSVLDKNLMNFTESRFSRPSIFKKISAFIGASV